MKINHKLVHLFEFFLRSTLGERFVIFGDPVVDGIPVHARREDSRFLVGRAMFKICAILNNY